MVYHANTIYLRPKYITTCDLSALHAAESIYIYFEQPIYCIYPHVILFIVYSKSDVREQDLAK